MDKVQRVDNSKCDTPSSEPYIIRKWTIIGLHSSANWNQFLEQCNCSLLNDYCFEGTCCFHFQGWGRQLQDSTPVQYWPMLTTWMNSNRVKRINTYLWNIGLHLHMLSVTTQEQQSKIMVLLLFHRTLSTFCKQYKYNATKIKFFTSELFGTYTFLNLTKYLRKSKLTAKTSKTRVISVTCGCFTVNLISHFNI